MIFFLEMLHKSAHIVRFFFSNFTVSSRPLGDCAADIKDTRIAASDKGIISFTSYFPINLLFHILNSRSCTKAKRKILAFLFSWHITPR